MKHILLIATLLAPAPAMADFSCTLERQCGGGTCEPFAGGPMLLTEAGDVWQVTIGDQTWEGYSTTTVTTGELSIVIPPQSDISGLVSVYPSGNGVFTVHTDGPDGLVVISGTGTCQDAAG
jgi:hypothetical protein